MDALEVKTLLASASRTATTTSDTVNNYGGTGVVVFVDYTISPNNTETMTTSIEVQDPASGKWVALTAFTALTSSNIGATATTETYVYTLYPGGAETAATGHHEVQSLVLPRIWRLKMTHSASTAWTYSVGISELP